MRAGCHSGAPGGRPVAPAQPGAPRAGRRRSVRRAQGAGGGLQQRPGDLRMVAHEDAELAARDAPAAHVGVGDDVGRALAAVDQRDLAEAVVALEPSGGDAALQDGGLALADDEEPRARGALAEDGRAAVVGPLAEAVRQRAEVVVIDAGQQRDTAQNFNRYAHLSTPDPNRAGVAKSTPCGAAIRGAPRSIVGMRELLDW